jgi:hypothetical protein
MAGFAGSDVLLVFRLVGNDMTVVLLSIDPALSGIQKGEQRQITLSVNDLQISCRTSYSPWVA